MAGSADRKGWSDDIPGSTGSPLLFDRRDGFVRVRLRWGRIPPPLLERIGAHFVAHSPTRSGRSPNERTRPGGSVSDPLARFIHGNCHRLEALTVATSANGCPSLSTHPRCTRSVNCSGALASQRGAQVQHLPYVFLIRQAAGSRADPRTLSRRSACPSSLARRSPPIDSSTARLFGPISAQPTREEVSSARNHRPTVSTSCPQAHRNHSCRRCRLRRRLQLRRCRISSSSDDIATPVDGGANPRSTALHVQRARLQPLGRKPERVLPVASLFVVNTLRTLA